MRALSAVSGYRAASSAAASWMSNRFASSFPVDAPASYDAMTVVLFAFSVVVLLKMIGALYTVELELGSVPQLPPMADQVGPTMADINAPIDTLPQFPKDTFSVTFFDSPVSAAIGR